MNQFEVTVQSSGGTTLTVVVSATSSGQAKSIAQGQYPGWTVTSTRDLGRS
jgi:hypothetical protein